MKITDIEIAESYSGTKSTYEATIKLNGNLPDLIEIIHAMSVEEPEISDEDE